MLDPLAAATLMAFIALNETTPSTRVADADVQRAVAEMQDASALVNTCMRACLTDSCSAYSPTTGACTTRSVPPHCTTATQPLATCDTRGVYSDNPHPTRCCANYTHSVDATLVTRKDGYGGGLVRPTTGAVYVPDLRCVPAKCTEKLDLLPVGAKPTGVPVHALFVENMDDDVIDRVVYGGNGRTVVRNLVSPSAYTFNGTHAGVDKERVRAAFRGGVAAEVVLLKETFGDYDNATVFLVSQGYLAGGTQPSIVPERYPRAAALSRLLFAMRPADWLRFVATGRTPHH